jgi:hypothetical protein
LLLAEGSYSKFDSNLGLADPDSGVSDLLSGSSSCPSGGSSTGGFPACVFLSFGFLVGVLDRFDRGIPRAGFAGLGGPERPLEDWRALRLPRSKPCVSCKSLAKRSWFSPGSSSLRSFDMLADVQGICTQGGVVIITRQDVRTY